ncbi:hypothetical protein [Butyrivibrio sp. INlla21]|uniref:hypothetical protein n=1 Tax=Butyrivibrio sp. INlla21 TaxID=1520811 RepID=UPI0008EE6EB4|nr:hypothetical protein [Butyrivibrio sp. INlla21]SFV03871.1 hypothetical protein SAMN02910342_03158 [Butyrivibrio sp. INlla21]
MENKIKYLEMIQGVINRMASNSFMLKGWNIALSVVGIFALSRDNLDLLLIVAVLVSTLFFWGLDAFYLQKERLYRSLYEKARKTAEENVDFSMTVSIKDFYEKKNRYICCFFSVTEIVFYLLLIIGSLSIVFINHVVGF